MSAQPSEPVTTIFARVVRAGEERRYEEWVAGISRASSGFVGNQGTTVLRPAEGRREYVTITQFDCRENLDRWLASDVRREWLARLREIDICSEEIMSMAGMERWFTPFGAGSGMPPRYKTASLILLGLYPLVLLLNLVLTPRLTGLPGPLQVLVSLTVSVAMMVWVVLPALTRLFWRWLRPRPGAGGKSGRGGADDDGKP